MTRYVLSRIGQAVIVLWAAYTAAFLILYGLPGDSLVHILAANDASVESLTEAELARVQEYYGLDGSLLKQYLRNLGGVLTGDLGQSISQGQSVNALLASRVPSTLLLGATSAGLALVLGVVLAVGATYPRNSAVRVFLSRLPAVGVSAPSFWVGLLLIQMFAFGLGWLPSGGETGWQSLILPSITMAIPSAAVLGQVLTRSLNDTLSQPFIHTATAKGLPRFTVYLRHAVKNASLPTMTILGLLVGSTVTGAVTTETVFTRVGVGRLVQESVLSQDVPVVLGIVLIAAAAFVVVNLAVDILYVVLDPRVRLSKEALAP
jgi:peptide/nickel transport system permease protein